MEIFITTIKWLKVVEVTLEWRCVIGSETCPSTGSAVMASGLHTDSDGVTAESE
jgi:hypothetical protein